MIKEFHHTGNCFSWGQTEFLTINETKINFEFLRRKTSMVTSLVAKFGNNRFFVENRIQNSN